MIYSTNYKSAQVGVIFGSLKARYTHFATLMLRTKLIQGNLLLSLLLEISATYTRQLLFRTCLLEDTGF